MFFFSGLCAAGGALGRGDYVAAAVQAADFIRANLYDEAKGVMLRSVYTDKDGVSQIGSPIEGFADDYAFFIRGLLDLYEATFEARFIEWAAQLQVKMSKIWQTDSST